MSRRAVIPSPGCARLVRFLPSGRGCAELTPRLLPAILADEVLQGKW